MLSFFRTNQILNSLIFLIYLLLARGSAFLLTPEADDAAVSTTPLADFILNVLAGLNTWEYRIVEFGLLFVQAVYISLIVRKHRLVSEYLLLPGAMYLLLASAIPSFFSIFPILVANTFVLIAIEQLMSTYRNPLASGKIFNLGFWIGLASLFYFPYVFLLLLAIFGLGSLRAFRISEFLAALTGTFAVYFLTATIYFWYDHLIFFWQHQFADNFAILNFAPLESNHDLVAFFILALLVLLVLFGYGSIVQKQNIQFQKKIGVLYIAAIISPLALFFQANVSLSHIAMLIIPIGILLGLLLANVGRTSRELIHFLLLIGILAWQLNPYWLK